MLACRIHAKEDLRIEPVAMPDVGPGQVLLRLGAGGICGSDLHYYYEGRNGSFVVREPLIPGHEASATVAAIGPGVTRVKAGDKVAVSPSHACDGLTATLSATLTRVTPGPIAATVAEASWPGISGSRTTKLPFLPS